MTGPSTIKDADRALAPANHSSRWMAAAAMLLACTAAPAQTLTPFSKAEAGVLPAPWRVVGFPGGGKTVSSFEIDSVGGAKVLKVGTKDSYGMALHEVPPVVIGPGTLIRWRWRLEQPLLLADLTKRAGDDTAVKVCAMFDMSTARLGLGDRMALSLARSRTTDPVPAATLCYVWDHLLPVGTEIPNVFSGRVRFLILETGEGHLGQWVAHERDLYADFQRAFGKETDTMPPLIGIAIGADADNTHGQSLAYVGDVSIGTGRPRLAQP